MNSHDILICSVTISHGFRECVMLMLSPKSADIVFRDVMKKIYEGQPYIKDSDMLLVTGSILGASDLKKVGSSLEETKIEDGRTILTSKTYIDSYEKIESQSLYNLNRRVEFLAILCSILFCVSCFVLSLYIFN